MIVIGIDCATDPKKVGIALAECDEGSCALIAADLGGSHEPLARTVAISARAISTITVSIASGGSPISGCASRSGLSTHSIGSCFTLLLWARLGCRRVRRIC